MKRIVIVFAAVCAILAGYSQVGYCAADQSQPKESFNTLNDYLRYAALHNAGLRSAFENWKAAVQQIPQANSLPDPRFTYAYFIEQVETRVGPQESKLGISQTFPWFGKIRARTAAAAAAANAAEKRYHAKKLELFYNVKNAWYEYTYLKSAIDIAAQNLELLKHFEEVARIRYMTAAGSHPDIIRAQIELAILEDKLESLNQFRSPVVTNLNAVLNRPPDAILPWPERIEFDSVKLDRKRVIADMRANNPQLAAIDFEVAVARSLITLAKKKAAPDITFGLDWIQTGSAVNSNVSGSGKDPVIAMVSLNLPIWGKSNKAAERQAKMQLAKTSSAKLQKENDIIAQLADVIYDFEDANRKIKLYRNILIPKAREMLEASEVAYRAAQIDFLSLIDAQRKLLNFELLHERAVTDNQQTLAQVQMLTGTETRQEQFASSK